MKKKLTARTVNAITPTGERFRVWDTEIIGFHVRVSPLGKRTYAISYRHKGLAKEFTLGTHGAITADQARDLAKAYIGLIAKGEDIQAEKKSSRVKADVERFQTLGAFITEKYAPWAERELRSATEPLRTLNRDFGYLHSRKLTEITPWVMEAWTKQAVKKGLKPSTINRRVTTLKSVLSRATLWGFIEQSPLKGTKLLRTDKMGKVRFLSNEEEIQLRSALDARERDERQKRDRYNDWLIARHKQPVPALDGQFCDHLKPLVLLALNTGMRRGEIFNLRWPDVDLKGKQLTIRGEQAKSGNTRYLPLNNEAFAILVAWRNQTTGDGLVFPSPTTGERLNHIKRSWAGLLKRAKIQDFRFHDLRHTFASKLVMAGVDLNTVRELLGHSSIDMTLRYAHLAPEHKAAAVALLDSK